MSIQRVSSISNHRSQYSQLLQSADTDRIKLFRKRSIVLKRTNSIGKLISTPNPDHYPILSPRDFNKIFVDNLKRYSQLYNGAVDDIDSKYRVVENGFVLSRKKISQKDMMGEKTRQQMNKNSEIRRERMVYSNSYNARFQNPLDFERINQNWKEWKFNRNSMETTAITHSTIEKTEKIQLPKTPLLSILENKARQFDERYSNGLDLPKGGDDQAQMEIRNNHFAYVRHRQTKSSMNSNPNTHSAKNYQTQANSNPYKLSNELKMIERYTRQQVDYTRSMEREREKRRGKVSAERKQKEEVKEEFRDKALIAKAQLRQCTFPFEASRCHSLRKAMNNMLILQQL